MKTSERRRPRLVELIALAGAVAVILAIAGRGEAATAVVVSPDCAAVAEGSFTERQQFTPYELRRSRLPDFQVPRTKGLPAFAAFHVPDLAGLPRQADAFTDVGALVSYFAEDLPADTTLSEFVAKGGIQLSQQPSMTEGDVTFTERLIVQLGDRAVAVKVGTYPGATTWADPDVLGNRPHHVYWSTPEYDFALIGNRSAAQLVSVARQLACDG